MAFLKLLTNSFERRLPVEHQNMPNAVFGRAPYEFPKSIFVLISNLSDHCLNCDQKCGFRLNPKLKDKYF